VLDAMLAWQRAGLPDGHPDIARTRLRRAGLLHRVDRADEAVSEATAALADFQRIFGERSSAAAAAHTTLGNALRETGDAVRAASHYEAALSIWRELLGAGNPTTLRAQFNLAQLYLRTPGLIAASRLEAMYRETLELGLTALGPDHPTIAVFRIGLAEFFTSTNRDARAMEVLVAPGAETALLAASPRTRGTYAEAVLGIFDRLGCRIASNSSTGLDRARVLEELPLIRAARCPTFPQGGGRS
jgi:hypothetical protein